MKLQLNGTVIRSNTMTLAQLLDEQGYSTATVATAVNGDFIPATLRATRTLVDGDQIEVLAPMQGG